MYTCSVNISQLSQAVPQKDTASLNCFPELGFYILIIGQYKMNHEELLIHNM